MIIEQHGNLLVADADALVNTVNTVGVMGKGIALQFKRAFPANFKAYKRACDAGKVTLGRMHVWDSGGMGAERHRFVINFPTKQHWKSQSQLADIESGLTDLLNVVDKMGIRSIAIPPLGCGLGGLKWSDVRPAIERAFAGRPHITVLLFSPDGAPAAANQLNQTARPKMTAGRATLILAMSRYLPFTLDIAPIEIHKLMYFLQMTGEPLELDYAKARYGPFASKLRHLLNSVEGHFVQGVGDGSAKALESQPFTILPGALDEAKAFLRNQPETQQRLERVCELIEGYESVYGLELLATTHWAAFHNMDGSPRQSLADDETIIHVVRSWNDRKSKIFTSAHVAAALHRLNALGWLTTPGKPPGTLFATQV